MVMVPRWVLLIVSGTLASVLVNLLHRVSPSKKVAVQKKKETEVVAPSKPSSTKGSSSSASTGAGTSGSKAKQRKGR